MVDVVISLKTCIYLEIFSVVSKLKTSQNVPVNNFMVDDFPQQNVLLLLCANVKNIGIMTEELYQSLFFIHDLYYI